MQEKKERKRSFDYKWIILLAIMVVVLIITIIINTKHTDNSSNKLISALDIDSGDQKINWSKYKTVNVNLSESFNITESGTYHLTGTLEDGSITIDAKASQVRLILDNVSIKNTNGPAIYCPDALNLVIETIGENTLEDGEEYPSNYDEDVTGAIYTKSDLVFQGIGTLNLIANHQDGIVGKDDVKFNDGMYKINAKDDSIRGKDSVYIIAGTFELTSGADAIKTTNLADTGKGFILIESGNFIINSSAKGIKSTKSLIVYDGTFDINSYDDAVHSDNYVGITGGVIKINSGDDGIHANKELIIDNGNIIIAKSYEGLEAKAININGGNISVTSTDDGINAGGGADNSAVNNHPGAGTFDADTDCVINITNGNLYINASGDGIDSNGYLNFSGGTSIVDGPTNNGNGALDASAGITMNGGTVIAVGASGMAETLGENSSTYNISVYFANVQASDTEIIIKDSANNQVLEHTSAKTFNHLAAGSEKFKYGETYTIYLNDVEYQSFTITDKTTIVGNSNPNQQIHPGMAPQPRR